MPSLATKKKLAAAMKRPAPVPSMEEVQAAAARPITPGYDRLTFSEIERQFAALEALSQRALATPASEDKVFTLLRRHYEDAHQIFVKLRNKEVSKHPAPKGTDDTELPASLIEARTMAIQALLETTHDIPTVPPHLILLPDDMPKPLKGELGQANKTSLAFLKHRLGFLYPLADERPQADGDDDHTDEEE